MRGRWLFRCVASVASAGSIVAVSACGEEPTSLFSYPEAGADEGGSEASTFEPGKSDGGRGCGTGCPTGLTCVGDVCVPPQPSCRPEGGVATPCRYDSYCHEPSGKCLPYGSVPEGRLTDPTCKLGAIPGAFAPKSKCEFPKAVPIVGDPFPNHVDVQATPAVARLGGPTAPPSIVVPFTAPVANSYTENLGVIRVLRGTDCAQEAVLGGVDFDADGAIDWARSSASVALADLDGDKNPEVIAYMVGTDGETMVAFTKKSGTWAPLWPRKKATHADGTTIFKATLTGGWAGPSVHDLDDDGKPEIVREGWVFDGATGKLRAAPPANYATYSQGIASVLANLDADPRVELTNGARVWELDPVANAWVEDTTYSQARPTGPGWSAIADFNPFDGQKKPEIAVATTDLLTIFKTDHSVFMGMQIAVPGGGGGPPTVADFDGDGLPEVALAGRAYYTVFDPDCQATPRPGGKCADRTHCDFAAGGACPDRILWSRGTQDITSNTTGSSIFDFEADGKAEAVYADECFARVYSGVDGRVLFSQYHSSCTWLENPIVADVDGDFRAELVVPNNTACGPVGVGQACTLNIDAQGVDTQFAGLVCQKPTDCVSGVCDQGYCRCTTSADCCADKDVTKCEGFGTKCANPPAGTAGAGKTCRANHPKGLQGIRVYEDAADRWVRSRTIWNQHAYAVTHVNEDGTIPKTSSWANNWVTPGLNNFRQNVPGTADAKDISDLTAQAGYSFACNSSGGAQLTSQACNRGTAPVGAGVSVGFYVAGAKVCSARTTQPLDPGKCEQVSCTWATPPGAAASAVDVTVLPNDDGAIAECNGDNNAGLVVGVFCTGIR